MKSQKYEQPKLELVSLTVNDILLASNTAVDTLDNGYGAKLGDTSWSSIFGE